MDDATEDLIQSRFAAHVSDCLAGRKGSSLSGCPWLEHRARMSFNGMQSLFCSAWGQPLSTGCIHRMLPTLGHRAGFAKRVHAYGLRHTHAAELRDEGVDISVISKQFGHTDISTTARYLDHIAPWAVVEAVRARTWVQGARA